LDIDSLTKLRLIFNISQISIQLKPLKPNE